MGSWNESCGLTHLPIRAGDEVALIILYGSGGTDYVYSTTAYAPISLPIIGEYNDYGGIENIKNPEVAEILFTYFKERIDSGKLFIAGMEEEGKELSDWEREKLFKDSDDMLNCIERGFLYGKEKSYDDNIEYEIHTVNFMMVHKSVLDRIVSEYGGRVPYKCDYTLREAYTTVIERDRGIYIEKVSGDIVDQVEDAKEDEAPNPVLDRLQGLEGGELLEEILKVVEEEQNEELSEDHREALSEGLSRIQVDMSKGFFMKWEFKDMCKKLFNDTIIGSIDATYIMKEYFENGAEVIREGMLDFIMMKYIFSRARIDWRPSSGRGSQSQEYGVARQIFEEGQKIIDKEIEQLRKWREEDGEEPKSDNDLLNDDYISDPLGKY